MCGSPLGMFLSLLDSALDTDSLFNFKTTKRFFNLFHVRKKRSIVIPRLGVQRASLGS